MKSFLWKLVERFYIFDGFLRKPVNSFDWASFGLYIKGTYLLLIGYSIERKNEHFKKNKKKVR